MTDAIEEFAAKKGWDDEDEEEEREDNLVDPKPSKGKKKQKKNDKPRRYPDGTSSEALGKLWYGETFTEFQKIGELEGYISSFKDFYYKKRVADKGMELTKKSIIIDFNTTIAPERFHPYPTQLRNWTTKWDKHILEQLGMKDAALVKKGEVYQVIRTRAQERALAYNIPEDDALEAGVRTLGGELLNDAMQVLRDDQDLEEIYDTDELMKRRNYVVNVFAHTTRLVHGKAALQLKASQEKRETASFLMDLMREAAAGKLSKDKIDILKTTATPVVIHENEPASTG